MWRRAAPSNSHYFLDQIIHYYLEEHIMAGRPFSSIIKELSDIDLLLVTFAIETFVYHVRDGIYKKSLVQRIEVLNEMLSKEYELRDLSKKGIA